MAPIGRPKKHKKQSSILDAFGINQQSSQPRVFQNNVDVHPTEDHDSNSIEIFKDEQTSKRLIRTFKSKWKTRFLWAYAVKDCNGVEKIKCSLCVKYKRETPFVKDGSTTLQISGLNAHAKSEAHKFSLQLLEGESKKNNLSITKHVELMVDAEKERIISVMENMYFVAIHDLPLEVYKSICDLNMYK